MRTPIPASSARERLSAVVRSAGEFISVDSAAAALGVSRQNAARTLARWQHQGWIARVRRGLYTLRALESSIGDTAVKDPWTLVPALFGRAYVGGASAAHHWDLTEQLFRPVFVYTTQDVRHRETQVHGATFVGKHIGEERYFGTKTVWRDSTRVLVSDPHRTIVDLLDDPSMGGGITHVADCLHHYLRRPDAAADTLLEYAERAGNGAVFKRLGFLAERAGAEEKLIAGCAARLTQGNAKLDPALPCPRLVRRWRLWVPERWKRKDSA
ncbi:MAG: type IV toxin-antitoxin system AbiEi family antitoxin domain-containing protein [Pseudomonadota bacterium]